MSDPILRLRNVATDIAQYHILHDVSFDVPRGAVTMRLGRNGAGKTTTMRTIMGLWKAKSGEILLDGTAITALPPPVIAGRGVAFVPENMRLAAISGPINPKRREMVFTAFPALRTFWNSPAGTLSGGQKQMLSVARAMIEDRRLYLIDEPSKGLAPAIVSTMVRAMRGLKRDGASILMVEQNFAMATALGDHAVVMDNGRIVWSGAMAELAGDAHLRETLIGLSMEKT